MKAVKVGLVGFGTVGTGVVRVLRDNAEVIRERLGFPLLLAKVADRDVTSDRGVAVDPALLTTDALATARDPAFPLVVELVGGTGIARRRGSQGSEEAGNTSPSDTGREIIGMMLCTPGSSPCPCTRRRRACTRSASARSSRTATRGP